MIIKEIDISDFRSHKKTNIKLDQGITVIVGDNGSGKTSILEAVNFALFKQKPKDVNMDDLIRRGATEAKVSVTIYNLGKLYKVTRGRKIGKAQGSSLHLIENGLEKMIATGEEEINRELEKILSVNGELFTNSIYIRQGEIDSLISANPAKRKELMGKLLGAEDLEKAYVRMVEILRENKILIQSQKDLPIRIKNIKNRIDQEKKGKKEMAGRIKSLIVELEGKRKVYQKIEGKLNIFSSIKDLNFKNNEIEIKIKHAKEDLQRIDHNRGILNKNLPDYRKYLEIQEEIGKLILEKNRFLEKTQAYTQLMESLDQEKKSKASLDEKIRDRLSQYSKIMEIKVKNLDFLKKNYLEELENLDILEKNLEKKVKEITQTISETKGQNLEKNKAIAQLENAKDKCPVCSQRLSQEHKEVVNRSFVDQLKQNKGKILKNENKLERFSLQLEELKRYGKKIKSINLEVLENWNNDLVSLENQIKKQEVNLKFMKNAIEDIENPDEIIRLRESEKKALENKYREYLAAKQNLVNSEPEFEKLKKELESLQDKSSSLTNEIKDKSQNLGKISEFDLEFENLKDKQATYLQEITENEKRISGDQSALNEKNRMLDTWNEELKDLMAKQKENEKLVNYYNLLQRIRNLFHKDNLQRELRERAIPLVEKYCREVFDRFDLPYSDICLDDDFSMKVYGTYGEESVEMLSGGEKIAAALSLRIGIAKALSGPALESIMLDEPTIHLDNHRRLELVEIIRRLSSIPQTIVVTHDKEFEQSADRLLVVEKSDSISHVSQEG